MNFRIGDPSTLSAFRGIFGIAKIKYVQKQLEKFTCLNTHNHCSLQYQDSYKSQL